MLLPLQQQQLRLHISHSVMVVGKEPTRSSNQMVIAIKILFILFEIFIGADVRGRLHCMQCTADSSAHIRLRARIPISIFVRRKRKACRPSKRISTVSLLMQRYMPAKKKEKKNEEPKRRTNKMTLSHCLSQLWRFWNGELNVNIDSAYKNSALVSIVVIFMRLPTMCRSFVDVKIDRDRIRNVNGRKVEENKRRCLWWTVLVRRTGPEIIAHWIILGCGLRSNY